MRVPGAVQDTGRSGIGTAAAPDEPASSDPAARAVRAATDQLALTALRVGLALVAAVTAADVALAAAAGADAAVLFIGSLLLAAVVGGACVPRLAAGLLTPRGRVLLLALLLMVLGFLDAGLRNQYADVEFGLACLAAIVASPPWVLAFLIASALGLAADYLVAGHPLSWVLEGPGSDQLVSQFSIMLAGAAVWVGVIWILRHTIATAPSSLASVREGAGISLTPRLGAAVRLEPAGLLVRADPAAIIEPLSPAERRVLDLLASGLLPKQAARALQLKLPTVRSQIASAKRKTGARTLEQLVGLYAEGRYAH